MIVRGGLRSETNEVQKAKKKGLFFQETFLQKNKQPPSRGQDLRFVVFFKKNQTKQRVRDFKEVCSTRGGVNKGAMVHMGYTQKNKWIVLQKYFHHTQSIN